jgi:hypothetical protein
MISPVADVSTTFEGIADCRMASENDSLRMSPGPNVFYKINENSIDYFVEISRLSDVDNVKGSGVTVEAYCILVEPKFCNNLVKDLSTCMPLEVGLLHLRRVRKQPISKKGVRNKERSVTQSERPNVMLQVLLGTCATVDPFTTPNSKGFRIPVEISSIRGQVQHTEKIVQILSQHGPLHKVMVPNHPPQSEQEWKSYNSTWPTHYYPLKTAEYQKQQKALSLDELKTMRSFILDAIKGQTVLIVDPESKQVVANTKREISLRSKEQCQLSLPLVNCLATPVLLSIQGVSRLERQNQVQQQNLNDSAHDNRAETKIGQHQYLCTGYDMYCYYEPSVFEAMACLHSRLRRLVYCKAGSPNEAVWRNGCSRHYIHDLPDANHRYRVFEYHEC